MSTWTSKGPILKPVVALAVAVFLSACVADLPGLTLPDLTLASQASRPQSVLGGSVTVAPPAGYCIDQGAGEQAGDQAVVLMGRCADTGGDPAAIIAVSLGASGSGAVVAAGPSALAAYFGTDNGRAALSRSGRAETVTLADMRQSGGALILLISDAEAGSSWRAFLGLAGRLVSVSVSHPGQSGTPDAQDRALLERALNALRRANAA